MVTPWTPTDPVPSFALRRRRVEGASCACQWRARLLYVFPFTRYETPLATEDCDQQTAEDALPVEHRKALSWRPSRTAFRPCSPSVSLRKPSPCSFRTSIRSLCNCQSPQNRFQNWLRRSLVEVQMRLMRVAQYLSITTLNAFTFVVAMSSSNSFCCSGPQLATLHSAQNVCIAKCRIRQYDFTAGRRSWTIAAHEHANSRVECMVTYSVVGRCRSTWSTTFFLRASLKSMRMWNKRETKKKKTTWPK